MTELAAELGVDLRNNAELESCEITDGKIQSIGIKTSQGTQAVLLNPNDSVVMAGDYHYMDHRILPLQYPQYSPEYWDATVMGPSSVLVYWGLDFTNAPNATHLREQLHAIPHHMLFFDFDMDHHMECCYTTHAKVAKPQFYVNRVSAGDASVAPPGCETMFVLIPTSPNGPSDAIYSTSLRDYVVQHLSEYLQFNLEPFIAFEHLYDKQDFINDYFFVQRQCLRVRQYTAPICVVASPHALQ